MQFPERKAAAENSRSALSAGHRRGGFPEGSAEVMPAGALADRARDIAELDRLAALLDARYRIPFTPFRFGIDAILGLIPGLGDAAAAVPALYLIWRARELGAPNALLVRMLANVGLDTLVGSVPIAGSVFDVFFKANRRNYQLLRRYLENG